MNLDNSLASIYGTSDYKIATEELNFGKASQSLESALLGEYLISISTNTSNCGNLDLGTENIFDINYALETAVLVLDNHEILMLNNNYRRLQTETNILIDKTYESFGTQTKIIKLSDGSIFVVGVVNNRPAYGLLDSQGNLTHSMQIIGQKSGVISKISSFIYQTSLGNINCAELGDGNILIVYNTTYIDGAGSYYYTPYLSILGKDGQEIVIDKAVSNSTSYGIGAISGVSLANGNVMFVYGRNGNAIKTHKLIFNNNGEIVLDEYLPDYGNINNTNIISLTNGTYLVLLSYNTNHFYHVHLSDNGLVLENKDYEYYITNMSGVQTASGDIFILVARAIDGASGYIILNNDLTIKTPLTLHRWGTSSNIQQGYDGNSISKLSATNLLDCKIFITYCRETNAHTTNNARLQG